MKTMIVALGLKRELSEVNYVGLPQLLRAIKAVPIGKDVFLIKTRLPPSEVFRELQRSIAAQESVFVIRAAGDCASNLPKETIQAVAALRG
jgi:hypothetical protein